MLRQNIFLNLEAEAEARQRYIRGSEMEMTAPSPDLLPNTSMRDLPPATNTSSTKSFPFTKPQTCWHWGQPMGACLDVNTDIYDISHPFPDLEILGGLLNLTIGETVVGESTAHPKYPGSSPVHLPGSKLTDQRLALSFELANLSEKPPGSNRHDTHTVTTPHGHRKRPFHMVPGHRTSSHSNPLRKKPRKCKHYG
jgi:hypothetical protein